MTGTSTVRGCCPLDCPDTCSWVVTVRDGEAVKLAGDRDHPYTRGVLCAKVNGYLDHARSPDRLLYPLRRTGPKGSGRFERITWPEALDEIATRWKAIIERAGAQAIWPYYGTGQFGLIQGLHGSGRRLWNVLGTSQHVMTICTIAGGVGTGYTIGDNRMGMDPETIRHARLILLWGTNTLSTNHHLWRIIRDARDAGAHLVVIDPLRTRTADQADEHLAPLPGTDAALALGLLHVVLSEGAEDRSFIAAHTTGWEAFRRRILDYPPERVADITGIDLNRIVALGKRLAHSRPTAIRMAMGVQRHGGGGMAVRTITCIPGVTGDWRHPGGGAAYDTRGFFGANWKALWRDDLRPADLRSLSMTRLAEGLLDLKDPPVLSLLVYGSNPVASVPDQARIRQGLSRDDLFTVAIEHFHTDTTAYADLVLPSTMQIEHADLHNAYGHLYLAWNQPAVPPPGECLPHSEIWRRLAARLGLTEPCLYDSDEDLARAVLASDHPSLAGITLERLREEGWLRLNYPQPFAPFAEGFPTASGRLEFCSDRMAADGLDPVAGYTPPHEAALAADTPQARAYPLALITPAAHYFLNSTFANVEGQRRREAGPRLLIHPGDASARHLVTGQTARVRNSRGSFTVPIEISDRVRPGVVACCKGHWPGLAGGANVNATVAERDSDMGGGAVFHDNRVEVEAEADGVQGTAGPLAQD